MKRILSEPLLHFMVIGAVLFAVYGLRERLSPSGGDTIVVTAGTIENLATTFTRTWQRPPTPEELDGLVDDFVVEEILSREAIRMGLDRNDTIIRRRLRQKMDFLTEDIAAMDEPTDAELAGYLRENPEDFRDGPWYSFRHIFLADDRDGDVRSEAVALLATLNRLNDVDPASLGDRLMLPSEFDGESSRGIAALFGEVFVAGLDSLPVGVWAGPIRSGYGNHLVMIIDRKPARVPPLEEVRDEVRRELVNARRVRTQKAAIAALRERYRVVIERPEGSAADGGGSE